MIPEAGVWQMGVVDHHPDQLRLVQIAAPVIIGTARAVFLALQVDLLRRLRAVAPQDPTG